MGSALIQGVLAAKVAEPADVSVHDKVAEPAEVLGTESGIRVLRSNREVAAASHVIMLCVKPEDALGVLREAAPDLASKLLVSIVAGITIDSLQEAAGAKCRVVRVMPNTAALVQKAPLLTLPGRVSPIRILPPCRKFSPRSAKPTT